MDLTVICDIILLIEIVYLILILFKLSNPNVAKNVFDAVPTTLMFAPFPILLIFLTKEIRDKDLKTDVVITMNTTFGGLGT